MPSAVPLHHSSLSVPLRVENTHRLITPFPCGTPPAGKLGSLFHPTKSRPWYLDSSVSGLIHGEDKDPDRCSLLVTV